jgi:phosphoserine phosphatase
VHVQLDELLAAIEALKLDEPEVQPLAFFDADHTLWAADLADVAFQLQIEEKTVFEDAAAAMAGHLEAAGGASSGDVNLDSQAFLQLYKQGDVSDESIIRAHATAYAGWTGSEVSEFGERIVDARSVEFYEGLDAILEAVQRRDLSIRVISGTSGWLVRGAVTRLGITPEAVQGALTKPLANGRLSDELVEPTTYREGKVHYMGLRQRSAAIGFGDSISDIPMLDRCQLRVGVNPRPALRAHATASETDRWRLWQPSRTVHGNVVESNDSDRLM